MVVNDKGMPNMVCKLRLPNTMKTEITNVWETFIAHFRAFWPRCLEFWHKDRLLSAKNWDKVLKIAEGRQGDVKLRLKMAYVT